ncbi:hypothetical protein [Achromobacter xylosoxidans]|uniref:hypothetical protein n=1 Tax=Alcaligenes xylosoxydans xylosoxydans TaxID=85698 RepID=UPI0006C1BB6C|nr:hypothetical protein [Achromobacter xylosoxidans]MCH1984773.1 hypothetical protein [Achromobacter xylosoxidans]MCH1992997.1 hypothetical protein [Achromobacter xylosoxidans]MCH4584440.1 hypothetical protein [Achromobacter xylosoxidans]CUI38486.1 Uncharacterised protein [Achromobacter xylosoxidans]
MSLVAICFAVAGSFSLNPVPCGSVVSSNKVEMSKALQAYMDTQKGLCAPIPAKRLPFTLAYQDPLDREKMKRVDALVSAGLLTKRDVELKAQFDNAIESAVEYRVTDMGKLFFVDNFADTLTKHGAFCTGKYTVVEVDDFTESVDWLGVKLSHVRYRYKVVDASNWAKLDSVRDNYKNFSEAWNGQMTGRSTLVRTVDGWVHERLFAFGALAASAESPKRDDRGVEPKHVRPIGRMIRPLQQPG